MTAMSSGEVPMLLTVPEAARALRIGRATAYDLAHMWLDSAGTKGLPVVTIGRSLRVPTAALERLISLGGFGPCWESGLTGGYGQDGSPGEHTQGAVAADTERGHRDRSGPTGDESGDARRSNTGVDGQLSLFETTGR